MERVPVRIGVAGDWHGNTAWATRAVRKMTALLPADGPRLIVHLGDFGIWPGPGGQEYLARLDAALAEAGAELSFVDGNHEDFTQLARLQPGPDGRAQVTERIFHLPRGHRWRWHGRDWLALGGAVSLDRAGRTEGVDWWPEEEITLRQAGSVIDAGPADVMVTHECPDRPGLRRRGPRQLGHPGCNEHALATLCGQADQKRPARPGIPLRRVDGPRLFGGATHLGRDRAARRHRR